VALFAVYASIRVSVILRHECFILRLDYCLFGLVRDNAFALFSLSVRIIRLTLI
jgi:hypothetical protein